MNEILNKALEYAAKYRVVGRAHYLAADHCLRLNKLFGIPVIIITAVVGTTIFGTLEHNPNLGLKILAGVVSLLGTVLAALQTTLGFAQTAEKHKAAGEAYRSLQRKFEMFELKYRPAGPDKRDTAISELEALVDKLQELPKSFPSVPDRYYKKAKAEEEPKQIGNVRTTTSPLFCIL
jgi:hypothetical protein